MPLANPQRGISILKWGIASALRTEGTRAPEGIAPGAKVYSYVGNQPWRRPRSMFPLFTPLVL